MKHQKSVDQECELMVFCQNKKNEDEITKEDVKSVHKSVILEECEPHEPESVKTIRIEILDPPLLKL